MRPEMTEHHACQESSLLDQPVGRLLQIKRFHSGKQMQERLKAMGLNVGSVLEIKQKTSGGALIVGYQNTRLAIGRGEAAKIMVDALH